MESIKFLFVLLLAFAFCKSTVAQEINIKMEHVAGHVYAVHGPGGTIGVSVGSDGIYLIDDKFSPVTPKLKDELAQFNDKPIRFVINTHWHGDHTGANEDYRTNGAIIIAHDNVRLRMTGEQFLKHINVTVPPRSAMSLPEVTFSGNLALHFNGDVARVVHAPKAHTDGDSLVIFPNANVIHMGDVYFSGMYPFIDTSSGGHVDGVVSAIVMALDLSDEETKFIAGHGPVTGRDELEKYLADVRVLRDWVREQIDLGSDLSAIVANIPQAPVNPDRKGFPGESDAAGFVAGAYVSLTGKWE